MELKFSVIIPVYNCEMYIAKCVESVLSQGYKNYELIIINNGSTDESYSVCKQYTTCRNVNLINVDINAGVSKARNLGLEMAKGEYVIFMDSDDFYVEANFFEELNIYINKNINADLIMIQAIKYINNSSSFADIRQEFSEVKINGHSKEDCMEYLVRNGLYNAACWNKVLKRRMLIDNDLFFKEGIRGEDIEWFNRVIENIDIIGAIDKPFYAYRVRTNSTSKSGWNAQCWMDIYNFLKANMEQIDFDKRISVLQYDFYGNYYYILLSMVHTLGNKNKYYSFIKDIRIYEQIRISKKNKICYYIIHMFGYRIGSFLIYKYICR